jgi:ABC-type dipeptide/oligopeptide/nickel transport system permease subunit
MSPAYISVVISLAGVILSMTITVFLSGMRWGRMETKIDEFTTRLARIEGMFTLTLRKQQNHDDA